MGEKFKTAVVIFGCTMIASGAVHSILTGVHAVYGVGAPSMGASLNIGIGVTGVAAVVALVNRMLGDD